MPSNVLLDVGETLVGFRPLAYERIREILKDWGYDRTPKEVFRALVKSMGKSNFPNEIGLNPVDLREVLYELGLPPRGEILKDLQGNYFPSEWYLYDDAVDFLERWRSEGIRIVLVTNATRRMVKVVEELGILKYVDAVVASYSVGVVKPHPKIFWYATRYSGFPVIHIGDIYELDYLGAKRAYVDGVLLDRFNFYDDIKVRKVRSLKEVEMIE